MYRVYACLPRQTDRPTDPRNQERRKNGGWIFSIPYIVLLNESPERKKGPPPPRRWRREAFETPVLSRRESMCFLPFFFLFFFFWGKFGIVFLVFTTPLQLFAQKKHNVSTAPPPQSVRQRPPSRAQEMRSAREREHLRGIFYRDGKAFPAHRGLLVRRRATPARRECLIFLTL